MSRPQDLWEGTTARGWGDRLGVVTVELYDRIDSTNRRGGELVDEGAALPALVLADRQTAGRGRHGRSWISDTSDGLWFSLVLGRRTDTHLLPLLAGLAVARGADAVAPGTDEGLRIKWPNDVMAGGAKVGGVLCSQGGEGVVVGIGVNVNHDAEALPTHLDYPATSLRLFRGLVLARGALLLEVVRELLNLKTEGGGLPEALRAELDERSFLRGRPLAVAGTVRHSSGAVEAVDETPAIGGRVMPDGTLELLLEGGGTAWMVAGSVRLRET